jgi:WD40 repeat protein
LGPAASGNRSTWTSVEILTLRGHTGGVRSECRSPDGSRLATASEDQPARAWDARAGAKLEAAGR